MKNFTLILLTIVFAFSSSASELPPLTDLTKITPLSQDCENNNCVSLEESIELARKNNFESRIDALRVYQARQFIKVRVGQLLPSFNLRIASPLELFDYIPNLVGFLFPSNWFRLKESKMHAKAAEKSFLSLMANQINSTESLYYNLHKETINLSLYKKHQAYISKLKTVMEQREARGELQPEEVEKAKLFLSDININEITLSNALGELYPQMGYALNLPSVWNSFEIKSLELPNLNDIEPIEFDSFFDEVVKKSYELQSIEYLKLAAKYSKKARYFEFLTPDSGTENAFGFGYLNSINIGKADQKIVEVQGEMYNASLKEALYKIVSNYNTSLELYAEANNAIDSIEYILETIMEDFEINSVIEFEEFKEMINENLYFQWMKNYAIHGYLLANAQLDRLLIKGDFYEDLESLLPSKKKKKLKRYQRRENRKIDKAIKRGELNPDLI